MNIVKMQAKVVFTHVIQGQIYHGDPNHPNKEDGQRLRVKEEHVDELERLGFAKLLRFREVEDAGEDAAGQAAGATILGERPGLDNAISNPGGEQFNSLPTAAELAQIAKDQAKAAEKPAPALQEQEQEQHQEELKDSSGGAGGDDDGKIVIPTEIGKSIVIGGEGREATIKFVGSGWYEISAVGEDGETVSKKLRKGEVETAVADYEAALAAAAAAKDPTDPPR